MPTHKIMDHNGHSEKVWDKADVVSTEGLRKPWSALPS